MEKTVDLNCDLGESFGMWKMGNDEAILPFVSSINIACGFHAGDPDVMHKTVQLALDHDVAIGAHPGFADLQGFGRRNIAITAEEVYNLIIYQVGALQGFTHALGGDIHHVKPHGALYNMAAVNQTIAFAIAQAVADISKGHAILYGLSGSALIEAGESIGLRTKSEVFADRSYQADGTLTARSEPNALITDHVIATEQVLQMVREQSVTTVTGSTIPLKAETICVHGDGVVALKFVKKISQSLTEQGIKIKA